MRLPVVVVPGLALTLLLVTGSADRAIVGRAAAERAAAHLRIDEETHLAAIAVRAALIELEQAVMAGRAIKGVLHDRTAVPPVRQAPASAFAPYGNRSRAQLAELLVSREATPSGLPEAVVARLALGPAMPLSGPDAPRPVVERFLDGELPVRPEDLPFLARRLEVLADPRVEALGRRLRRVPGTTSLPQAPAFRRRLTDAMQIESWAQAGTWLVRYELPADLLVDRAEVAQSVAVRPLPDTGEALPESPSEGPVRTVAIPDLPGLRLRVAPRDQGGLRLAALRAVLWLSAGAGLLGLFGLRRALRREAQALRRERAFLASVTHELRTPLTSIRVFGESLADGHGDPREYGTLVSQESYRLESLVERVLTLTRLDQALRFGPVDPAEVLQSAVAVVQSHASTRSTQILCETEDGLPTCHWDAEAVRRALLNLLENAVVHGRNGGRIAATAVAIGGQIRYSVQDDGPGIRPRERRRIFGRFQRGDSEASGTGLGLFLAEQVARAHGGRIDLATTEGHGSTFTLVLPVAPSGQARKESV